MLPGFTVEKAPVSTILCPWASSKAGRFVVGQEACGRILGCCSWLCHEVSIPSLPSSLCLLMEATFPQGDWEALGVELDGVAPKGKVLSRLLDESTA